MNDKPRQQHEDEVTLGEFLRGIAGSLRWIKNNIIGLAICIIIGMGIAAYVALQKPTVYNAHLTFMLTNNKNGQMAGLSSVLGQFGIPLSSGKLNIDKLMEVAKARRITANALLRSASVNDKTDLLANHYIEVYELNDAWSENGNDEFSTFKFQNTADTSLTATEQFALKKLHKLLIGSADNRDEALINMDYGNPDYIMSFDAATLEPSLSIATANYMYEELKEFYVEKAIKNYQDAYDLVKSKRDSIAKALSTTEYQVALLRDQNINTYANTNNVKISSLGAQAIGLRLALQEVEKNLGVAEYALKTSKPAIDLLDAPVGPLSPSKPSLLKYILAGFVLGVAAYIAFYLLRLVLKMV